MQEIQRIIIHCSASPNGKAFTADDIRHWHTDPKPRGRGWKHAGYHFVIEVDGNVSPLVPLDDDNYIEPWEIANGAAGFNADSIHICMIGTDKFTRAQWEALGNLISDIGLKHGPLPTHGHNEFNAHKTCPGFSVKDWLQHPAFVEQGHLQEAQSC